MARRNVAAFPALNGPKPITRTTKVTELPQLCRRDEVSAVLGIGRDAAYKLLNERGISIGKRKFLPRAVIEELLRPKA